MSDEPDKVTVSETVTVDIGDYEKRNAFASYTTTIRDGEKASEAYSRADKEVMKQLRVKERKMRIASEDDVTFDTMEKLSYHVSKEDKKKKKSKKKNK